MIDLANIAPAFLFVVTKGLMPSAGVYKPQEFGNASLLMKGVPFSLRFERDRGQVFVDISGNADEWNKLEYVLEFVDRALTQQQLGEPPGLTTMANLLQTHWNEVADLFEDPQKANQFQAFAQQKTAVLLNAIFRKP